MPPFLSPPNNLHTSFPLELSIACCICVAQDACIECGLEIREGRLHKQLSLQYSILYYF